MHIGCLILLLVLVLVLILVFVILTFIGSIITAGFLIPFLPVMAIAFILYIIFKKRK
ncbi:MAG TPA: hypothetical protein GXX53_02340 [Tissierellia bacterium]|nr:hypothetical protein [Tissierellia bacterium]